MKRLPGFLRSTTFRITVLTTVLFAISMVAILFFVFQSTASAFNKQAEGQVARELTILEASYRAYGINGINRAVVERSASQNEFLYLFTGPTGERVSGNLSALPENGLNEAGYFRFTYRPFENEPERQALARLVRLSNNYLLLVAVDVEEQARFMGRIRQAMLLGAGLVVIMGLIAGALISRRFTTRIEALNQVARDVMAGDMKRRAPRNDSRDELDEFASHLNRMLSRIESLMAASMYAGDSIAHDLRSPLTRMRGRLEENLRDPDIDPQQVLADTLSDTDELLNIFNSIQRISRLETGEQRSVFQVLDPAELLCDLAELYEPVCEDAGMQFSSEIRKGLKIRADQGLLAQAVSNILDNAIKYAGKGGAIALRLRRRADGQVEISVTDTGPGVPADKRDAILKRFVRLEESRNQPGSGLGLSLVKAVAEIHSADLLLEDGPGSHKSKGSGLRVALVFPRAKPQVKK